MRAIELPAAEIPTKRQPETRLAVPWGGLHEFQTLLLPSFLRWWRDDRKQTSYCHARSCTEVESCCVSNHFVRLRNLHVLLNRNQTVPDRALQRRHHFDTQPYVYTFLGSWSACRKPAPRVWPRSSCGSAVPPTGGGSTRPRYFCF